MKTPPGLHRRSLFWLQHPDTSGPRGPGGGSIMPPLCVSCRRRKAASCRPGGSAVLHRGRGTGGRPAWISRGRTRRRWRSPWRRPQTERWTDSSRSKLYLSFYFMALKHFPLFIGFYFDRKRFYYKFRFFLSLLWKVLIWFLSKIVFIIIKLVIILLVL